MVSMIPNALKEQPILKEVQAIEGFVKTLSEGNPVDDELNASIERLKELGQGHMYSLFSRDSVIPLISAKRIVKLVCSFGLILEDDLKFELSKVVRIFSEVVAHKLAWQGRGLDKRVRDDVVRDLKTARKCIPHEFVVSRFNLKCAKAAWQSTEGGMELAKKFIRQNWTSLADGIAKGINTGTAGSKALSLPTGLLGPLQRAIKLAHSIRRKTWFHPSFRLHLRRNLFVKGGYNGEDMFNDLSKEWDKDHAIAFAAVQALDTLLWFKVDPTSNQKLDKHAKKPRGWGGGDLPKGVTKELILTGNESFRGYKFFVHYRAPGDVRGGKKELGWKVRYLAVKHLIDLYFSVNSPTCFALLKERLFVKKGEKNEIVEENRLVRWLLLDFYRTTHKNTGWGITRLELVVMLQDKEKNHWDQVQNRISKIGLSRTDRQKEIDDLRKLHSTSNAKKADEKEKELKELDKQIQDLKKEKELEQSESTQEFAYWKGELNDK